MAQEAINHVLHFGKNNKTPKGVIIRDMNDNADFNEFECNDIKGVCACNSQHNLHPPQQNKNKNKNQQLNVNDKNKNKKEQIDNKKVDRSIQVL